VCTKCGPISSAELSVLDSCIGMTEMLVGASPSVQVVELELTDSAPDESPEVMPKDFIE
jgi:hypothetical protein